MNCISDHYEIKSFCICSEGFYSFMLSTGDPYKQWTDQSFSSLQFLSPHYPFVFHALTSVIRIFFLCWDLVSPLSILKADFLNCSSKIYTKGLVLTEDNNVWLWERWSYLSFSSLHRGSSSTTERSFTPGSLIALLDRSRCLRCEGFDLRTEVRAAQSLSVTPQSLKL